MNELEEYFRKLRFDKNFHLGLDDVCLTTAMQEEVIKIAKRVASQQSVQRTGLESYSLQELMNEVFSRRYEIAETPRR